jgi:(2Fe-2S) ferredoxin
VLLVWPDGCVYGGVTPERIEGILRMHVLRGEPVQKWILKKYLMERHNIQDNQADENTIEPKVS